MDWNDKVTIKDTSITFLTAQHWSARGLTDRLRTLWGSFLIEKDNSATTNSSVATISDDTFLTASFHYNPNGGSSGGGAFEVFIDDSKVATETTLTNAPDDEDLTVSFGIQNGAAAAKTMTVDYIFAAVER